MKNILKWGIGVILFTLMVTIIFQVKSNDSSAYNTRIYAVNSGYGYEISKHDKILIKQDHIPAISEQHTFCNSDDALKVANLVISKLENKETPRITKAELKTSAVALNCLN